MKFESIKKTKFEKFKPTKAVNLATILGGWANETHHYNTYGSDDQVKATNTVDWTMPGVGKPRNDGFE